MKNPIWEISEKGKTTHKAVQPLGDEAVGLDTPRRTVDYE